VQHVVDRAKEYNLIAQSEAQKSEHYEFCATRVWEEANDAVAKSEMMTSHIESVCESKVFEVLSAAREEVAAKMSSRDPGIDELRSCLRSARDELVTAREMATTNQSRLTTMQQMAEKHAVGAAMIDNENGNLRTLLKDAVSKLEEQRVETAEIIRSCALMRVAPRPESEPAYVAELKRELQECQAGAMLVVERINAEKNQAEMRAQLWSSECAAKDRQIEIVTTECAQALQLLDQKVLYPDDDDGDYEEDDIVEEDEVNVPCCNVFLRGLNAVATSKPAQVNHQISTPEPVNVPIPDTPLSPTYETPRPAERSVRVNASPVNQPHFPVGRSADHGALFGGTDATSNPVSKSGNADVMFHPSRAPPASAAARDEPAAGATNDEPRAVTAADLEKAAGRLVVPPFPSIGTIDAWEAALATNLRAASAFVDGEEIPWIKETRTRTFEELRNSGERRFA
jgi:hypothetical protein